MHIFCKVGTVVHMDMYNLLVGGIKFQNLIYSFISVYWLSSKYLFGNCFLGKSGFGYLRMEGFRLFPRGRGIFTKQPVPIAAVAGEGGNEESALFSKTGFLEAQHLGRDTA